MNKIKLFVDKVEPNDLGGMTNDKRKAEYILSFYRLSFEELLKNTSKETKIPSGALIVDRFILVYNISWDLSFVNFGLFNYKLDIDENFDLLADCFSPKAVQGFHTLKKEIEKTDESKLHKVVLSDSQINFEMTYQIYSKLK